MECIDFVEKYNTIDINFLRQHQFGVPILQAIHTYLFESDDIAGIIRYQEDNWEYQIIEKEIQKMIPLFSQNITIEEYINNVCKCVAVINLYQPFFDGNTRTCIVFQNLLLKQKQLTINITPWEQERQNNLIGTIYNEKDPVSINTVNKIKKRILEIS